MSPPVVFALTVWQPWADLIIAGVKTVENRSWPPPSTLPQWWRRCDRCGRRSRDGVPETIPVASDGRRGTSVHWHDVCAPGLDIVGNLEPDGPFPFRLGIHAGRRWDPTWTAGGYDGDHWIEHPTLGRFDCSPYPPRSGLVGFVTVTLDTHHADECACVEEHDADVEGLGYCATCLGEEEARCSRWAEPDCWHWTLADPEPLDTPVPMRGYQKLWRLPEGVKESVEK